MPLERYRYGLHILGKGKINEIKMHRYVVALLKKEGIPFIVSTEPNGGFAYSDEELFPFIKEMGVEHECLNVKMIRDEIKVGHDRVLRIMKKLVDEKTFREVKGTRGREWTMYKKRRKNNTKLSRKK